MTYSAPAIATPLAPAVLGAGKAQWDAEGYAIIEGALPSALCTALAEDILGEHDRLAAAGETFKGGGALSGHLNCFPGARSQALAKAVDDTGLTQFMSEVFGRPVKLASVGCNANLPGSHYQNFHTDSDWTNGFMVINIALVDTDLVNGATELVPATNKAPLRYWRFITEGLWRRGVRHPMKPGDVMIRPSTLWHRGTPNRSDRMRPMVGLVYTAADSPAKPVDYLQDGGRPTFMANRFGSDIKGRFAEIIGVYFSWLHACVRFVKSFMSPEGRAT